MANTDLMLVYTLALFFVGVGFFAQYVNDEFDTSYSEQGLATDGEYSSTGILGYLASIASMFFYTFGLLPLWLDLLFIVLRIMFWTTIVKVLLHG